jgi:hypothetical protein
MDNFSINEEKVEDNLVRDFSCALCAGKHAKIRTRQDHSKRQSTKPSQSKAPCVKPCVIRREERRRNGVWFRVMGIGGGVVLVLRIRELGVKPQAVLPLTLLNPYGNQGVTKKLKCLAERRVTTGGWGADMRLGARVRTLYVINPPQDLYYSPHF